MESVEWIDVSPGYDEEVPDGGDGIVGTFEYATLTDEGIRLHTGELITEGRAYDLITQAIRLHRAGDIFGFYEAINFDKVRRLQKEGWSEDETHLLMRTYFTSGYLDTNISLEVTDASENPEVQAYMESKNNF